MSGIRVGMASEPGKDFPAPLGLTAQQRGIHGNMNVSDKSLLIVDDDGPFLNRLGRAMERKGFDVRTAQSVAAAMAAVKSDPPCFAVIDMRFVC